MPTPLEELKAIFALPKPYVPAPTEYSIFVDKLNPLFREGKKAKTKEEQDKIVEMISDLSSDINNAKYPKMTISEFLPSGAKQAALSPKEMLQSYYGENLPREIIAAGNYNIARPTIEPVSYPNMLRTMKVVNSPDYDSSRYDPSKEEAVIGQISPESSKINREWLNSNDEWEKKMAIKHFKSNSLDPNLPDLERASVLEHEMGHHISLAGRDASLPMKAYRNASIASNGFKEFGEHTGQPHETTQALGRFQREMFKNTGKRLLPVEFMDLVNKGKIPDFLTQEGRRILIYAKNLKEVADKSKDETKKKAAIEALWNISRMAPAVVQNKKQYGLNLPIG